MVTYAQGSGTLTSMITSGLFVYIWSIRVADICVILVGDFTSWVKPSSVIVESQEECGFIMRDRQTDRQTDRQRQTDGQRQTDRQTETLTWIGSYQHHRKSSSYTREACRPQFRVLPPALVLWGSAAPREPSEQNSCLRLVR